MEYIYIYLVFFTALIIILYYINIAFKSIERNNYLSQQEKKSWKLIIFLIPFWGALAYFYFNPKK